jgi:hypothetical protein
VNATTLVANGNKSLFFDAGTTDDVGSRWADMRLVQPAQLDTIEFTVKGDPPNGTTSKGTQQVVRIQSSDPVRTMVEFYLFCRDKDNPDGCALRVRYRHVDSTGETLVNTTLNQTQFQIRMGIDWVNSEYRLFVNGVDDGIFPFLELPQNVHHLRVQQHRGDIPWRMSLDDVTAVGATNKTTGKGQSDIADGLKSFAQDIRFTTSGSQFFLGLLFWLTIMAAVIMPMVNLGMDDTVLPAITFVGILAALWMVQMGFWPEWISVALIIVAAAAIAMTIREAALGVRNANQGASMVLGSLGYFVIASALLAFAGFGTDTINLPSKPVEQTSEDGQDINETQSFAGAVTECVLSGGAFTFGFVGDCSQDTQTTTWKRITDSAGRIFGWVQASVNFVFQLLTFRFPIPALMNLIIVGPPAAALSAYAVQVIRGTS